MKNLLYILGFVFSAMLLFSCEPNRDENGDLLFGVVPPKDPPSAETVKHLSKVTAETDGERQTIQYTYKDNKLVAVKSDGEDIISYDLSYGSDRIEKVTIKQEIDKTATTSVLTMNYENNRLISAEGDVKADTDGTILYKTKTEFSYNTSGQPEKIVTTHSVENPDHLGDYDPASKISSTITYDGKNVSNWKLVITTIPETPIGIPPVEVQFRNYDDKKNPFASLPLAYNMLAAHYNTGNQSILGLSANNYGEANIEGEVIKVLYDYNNDGYPTIANGGASGTITFEYQ